jgi:hypothetical protein
MSEPTWGDTVRVKASAPLRMRPGAVAAVVGVREVETPEEALKFDAVVGTKLYLIEFGDGDAVELAQTWIEVPQSAT